MSVMMEVEMELANMTGSKAVCKARLMQQYSDRQQEILKPLGGNIGDVPMDPEHEYYKLQEKIMVLGKM